MTKPFHEDVKHSVGLAQPMRPLADYAHLLQGHSPVVHMILRSVAGVYLKHFHGCDLPVRDRLSDTLRALIPTIFIGWMPCASAPA